MLRVVNERPLRAGDAVIDKETGETWVLAFFDHERDEAAWCGWPEGYIQNARARLSLKRAGTDEQYVQTLAEWTARRAAGGDGATDIRSRMGHAQLHGLLLAELVAAFVKIIQWAATGLRVAGDIEQLERRLGR